MAVFSSTLSQMAFLFLLIVIGYLLVRFRIIGDGAASLLSRLENWVFIPALVMGTFMDNFTVAQFATSGKFILAGAVVVLVGAPIAVFVSRLCAKDSYTRGLYTYGLAFSNFGFMGNAVVSALFPEVFMNYLIFVLPFWILIYLWGVPSLLMPKQEGHGSVLSGLKNLVNPMFIGMVVGMILGLLPFSAPTFFSSAVSSLGACMSPVAMLLTGMTVAQIPLGRIFSKASVYIVSAVRLLLLPLAGLAVLFFIPSIPKDVALCVICSLAMPLGLNTIVIPSAYGKDTTVGAGMALISHVLSVITIPLIFMLYFML
ncbi:MAG: AEC family transporter [Clostridia bacterium]|nr:AEC family transporter [Clostridia bacterium]